MYYIQMAGLQPKLLLWIQLDLLLMMEKKQKLLRIIILMQKIVYVIEP